MADAYQVIARRWRPRQFDELVGQEHIVRTLKNAIETQRIAHAYLFVGPRGTGKTTTARIFAKALNAEGGPNANPDDSSDISKAIMDGSCMDVIEIDGASNNGVDQIRDLRQECQYAPAQGTYKIYIIDEVHMLSNQAWNALLKTLEEPPPHVKFIFATTEAHKVLATVVSRCQRFEFRPIADDKIAGKLGDIAKAESINIEPEALVTIARMADGGMRDAQSILDQLISFCGSKITAADVLDVYGLASEDDLAALTRAMATADHKTLFATINKLATEGRDLYRLLSDIQRVTREALLDAIAQGGETDQLGATLSAESLTRMLDALQAAEHSVRQGLSQRVNFEVALLRAIDQSRSRAIDTVIKELSQLAAGLPEDAGQKKIRTSPPPWTEREKSTPPVSKATAVPAKQAFKPKPESPNESVAPAAKAPRPEPSAEQPLAASTGSEDAVAFDDEVPPEVAMAAAEAAANEARDDEHAESAPAPKRRTKPIADTGGVAFEGSEAFEQAKGALKPETWKFLDDKLRAVPKFVKTLPKDAIPEEGEEEA